MKKEIAILFICLSIAYCAVQVERAPASRHERRNGYACRSRAFESLGLMRANEVRNNYQRMCSRATCLKDGTIYHFSCGVVSVEGCELVQDLSKPYPQCCPKCEFS